MYRTRYPVLRRACGRLLARNLPDFAAFCEEQRDWLEDYALFMALKSRYDGAAWFRWPGELSLREPGALEVARRELAGETDFWKAVQFLFFSQWREIGRAHV